LIKVIKKSKLNKLTANLRLFAVLFNIKMESTMKQSLDSLQTLGTLHGLSENYHYYSLKLAATALNKDLSKLPYSLKILLENLLRFEDGSSVTKEDIIALAGWLDNKTSDKEICFRPARVLMQDFTGVPAVVDLAAMRDAMTELGADPARINPLTPVDLVIDHSVQVDNFATSSAFMSNVQTEMERNKERYEFLRWGQKAFDNFRVVPPGTGICHQVNLEYLSQVVWTNKINDQNFAYPDSLVGTDSHTTMVNGLSVLGWGVGGIEAEASMLGQAISMLIPEVIGFKLTGALREGITATDLVLTITNILRKLGVVGKFVEFYGNGLDSLKLADRATIANMAPEYGATCGFFPIDKETITYLHLSGRDDDRIALVETYAKAQGLWRDEHASDPIFTSSFELDLSQVEASLAGPKRPQDRVLLSEAAKSFIQELPSLSKKPCDVSTKYQVTGTDYSISHGDIVIAAITSCTNTSNPSVMVAAGLLARNAVARGLKSKPWVKTSLAPGSKVVTDYLTQGNLQGSLDALGFNLVGYGCTTCIGNSGPLLKPIEDTINNNEMVVSAVLSGNRNFEGRIHPFVKANYLASPPLVVAYALAGSININIATEPLGTDQFGRSVYLKDIWPSNDEIHNYIDQHVTRKSFQAKYADVFAGDAYWQAIKITEGQSYKWDSNSTYIKHPPYFSHFKADKTALSDIKNAAILAIFGDSITTDHISPAGNISSKGPSAKYLLDKNIPKEEFNSYGARRGNHEVMMRGTFANIRIKNELLPGTEGGITTYFATGEEMSIFDAAMKYKETNTPLVIIAGAEYGTGSSRDWAAKGTLLLGVKAVIAESFERIHRSNLVGMGIIPLTFKNNMTRKDLKLDGSETFDIIGLSAELMSKCSINCVLKRKDGGKETIDLLCRIDTEDEIEYVKNGGILQYVMRNLLPS
jgi:aconitate hydratase